MDMIKDRHGEDLTEAEEIKKRWQELYKITVDDDCSHEIKRGLLLGKKVMTNLDSIFKSRDVILPTEVCLVKAIVYPVVMYGCESLDCEES